MAFAKVQCGVLGDGGLSEGQTGKNFKRGCQIAKEKNFLSVIPSLFGILHLLPRKIHSSPGFIVCFFPVFDRVCLCHTVQWCNHGLLQTPLTGLKQSSPLRPLK